MSLELNRSNKLCCLCQRTATLFCSKCRVTPYCSIACQKKSWPNHKSCKLNNQTPSPDCITEIKNNVDFNLEYSHIVINGSNSPGANTLNDTISRLVGVDEFDPSADSYNWVGYENSTIIGFSNEDRFIYRGYWDKNYTTRKDLMENNLATQFLMVQNCRGSFVIYKCENKTGDNDSNCSEDNESLDDTEILTNVKLTRREIWEIIEYRFICSLEGLVTDRIHRTNMQRKEGLKKIKQTDFTVIDK
mmetsp:Transcript_11264/g.10894  ORF Transcript_11264/g.10894 Transcript_11264/m.10894 type:complete len:246 (-) Transcript_11264:76-813(-)